MKRPMRKYTMKYSDPNRREEMNKQKNPMSAMEKCTSRKAGVIEINPWRGEEMIKQYPMRVEENLWREAKAKAALEGVTLRAAIEELLCIWVEGKICIDKKAIKE